MNCGIVERTSPVCMYVQTLLGIELWHRISYRTALYRFVSQNRTIKISQELRDYYFDHIAYSERIEYCREYITLARLCIRIGILSSEFYVICCIKSLLLTLVTLIISSLRNLRSYQSFWCFWCIFVIPKLLASSYVSSEII